MEQGNLQNAKGVNAANKKWAVNDDWYDSASRSMNSIEQTVLSVAICPSAANGPLNPVYQWGPDGDETRSGVPEFAAMHYAFCKGVNDSWAIDWDRADQNAGFKVPADGRPGIGSKKGFLNGPIPANEKGMFNRATKVKMAEITDGTSNTYAIGEAAGGTPWPLCRGVNCTVPMLLNGQPMPANHGWLVGQPGDEDLPSVLGTNAFGCTMEKLNKWPVTDSWMSIGDRSSSTRNTASSQNGGLSSTSNFRSQHTGGGQFAYSDGSIHFVSASIDMIVYRGMSTIGGGEVVSPGE